MIMHQSHNIPWHILTSNFEIIHNDKSLTPRITYLRYKGTPNDLGQLKHFIRKFTQTIITFSETERKKYPLTFQYPTTGNLFSDELRDSYPDYLNRHNQKIEYWLACAHRDPLTGQRSYSTHHGRLADVVKILFLENELYTLLMLANHPNIPIAHLHSLSWGHHFGFSRVKESAIRAYMFFNSAYATGILQNGDYKELNEYRYLLREVATSMDFPAQQIPHIRFLTKCGVSIPIPCTFYGEEESSSLVVVGISSNFICSIYR
jgi:hypothetical protein